MKYWYVIKAGKMSKRGWAFECECRFIDNELFEVFVEWLQDKYGDVAIGLHL